ncbi:MAG: hypothetical protein KF721_01625 [Ignavibacteriaceae bacterium]|nr:hypothetical protein [Ignavibacteriaceae bacterium]
MGQYNSNNKWVYNCAKEDLDYRAEWGINGSLTVHVTNLKAIRYTMWGWNSRDGWVQSGPIEQTLEQTTSQPYIFNNVSLAQAIGGANTAHLYWNRRYKIETY